MCCCATLFSLLRLLLLLLSILLLILLLIILIFPLVSPFSSSSICSNSTKEDASNITIGSPSLKIKLLFISLL